VRQVLVQRPDGGTIAVELVGEQDGGAVLLCHGLADSRLLGRLLEPAARELGLLVISPDRPGTGQSDFLPLRQLADWAQDARAVLDELEIASAAMLGISAGGPFAAACAARLPDRVRALLLVSALGEPAWGRQGMASGERLSMAVASVAPGFGGWFLGRLASLARRAPDLFLRVATSELPAIDRAALARPEERDAFVAGYLEAFRSGSAGVAQDLRLLTRPWGFSLSEIRVPTWIHHGDADTTVPSEHAYRFAAAIAGSELRLHAGHGHFSLDLGASGVLAPAAGAAAAA
jgi:pimeloyl-ACP methyl ester carboxylesterase